MKISKILQTLGVALVCLVAISSLHAAGQQQTPDGLVLFHEKGCDHCHGSSGKGTDDGPDLTNVRKRLKPDAITHQIHDGGKSMPAFGDSLTDDEIKALVKLLSSKRRITPIKEASSAHTASK